MTKHPALFIALLTLGFLRSPTVLAGPDDQNYRIATLQSPDAALPYLQYSGKHNAIKSLLFPPILTAQADGRVRCILCKDVPTIETKRGKDLEYSVVLELKKDLHWGDGQDVNADDVKFSLEMMAKAPYPPGQAPILPISRIVLDKDEKRKMTLYLRHRRGDAFQLFSISLLPVHKKAEVEAAWSDPKRVRELLKHPDFAYGPLKIESSTADRWTLVSNNKTDWERNSDRAIELRFLPDAKSLADAMKKGEIDQTLAEDLDWKDYQQIQEIAPDLRYQPTSVPSSSMNVLLVNMHSPTLVNPQLRQALFFSIDRKRINAQAYKGLAEAAEGMISQAFADRVDEKRVASYQPKLATQMLDKAGWQKFDGKVRVSEGQRLSLSLICPSERLKGGWVTILKENLAAQGIELTIESPSEDDYTKKILSHRRFRDLACVTWTLPPMSVPNNLFHSLAIPNIDNDFLGSNYSAWDQSVVDRILDSMLKEIDLPHYAKLFGRLDKIFLNELPAIPLVYLPRVTLTKKDGLADDAPEVQTDLARYPGSMEKKKM